MHAPLSTEEQRAEIRAKIRQYKAIIVVSMIGLIASVILFTTAAEVFADYVVYGVLASAFVAYIVASFVRISKQRKRADKLGTVR